MKCRQNVDRVVALGLEVKKSFSLQSKKHLRGAVEFRKIRKSGGDRSKAQQGRAETVTSNLGRHVLLQPDDR